MEITLHNGDITKSGANVIGHQTNCLFVMGGGVALAIRKTWPKVYNEYVQLGKSEPNKKSSEWLGTCQIVQLDSEHYVANLFGQDEVGFGCMTNYDALKEALVSLKRQIAGNQLIKTVAFPWLMSCGLAGGDWGIVKPLVENVFSDTDIELQWWKF